MTFVVGSAASSVICAVATAVRRESVAPPVGFERLTVNVSLPSTF
jgi:hypothetical protein